VGQKDALKNIVGGKIEISGYIENKSICRNWKPDTYCKTGTTPDEACPKAHETYPPCCIAGDIDSSCWIDDAKEESVPVANCPDGF
jgi:hypothetical protein